MLVILRDAPRRARSTTSSASDTSWSTNIRTPTSGQYLWLRLLAQERKNICCVGDDDQSIYSWRGAEVANILRFEKDFPGAKVIRLEQNYRSTPHILAAASGLIAHNAGRLGKTLWTERGDGEKVQRDRRLGRARGSAPRRRGDRDAPARAAAASTTCAILVRAQFQTREFEDRFIAIGLPYRIVGGFRFYERAEIRDALAYLRVIAQPADDLAFERIVNIPKRGLGDKAVAKHPPARPRRGMPLLLAAARILDSDELTGAGPPRARQSGRRLRPLARRWLDELPHPELARIVLDESGYTAMLQADRSAESAGRLENLAELARAMEEYETLGAFLEHVTLVMDNDAGRRGRQGHDHDHPRRQGAGVRHRLPRRLGGRRLPLAARARRGRQSPASRRSAASPMSRSPARAQRCIILHAANRRIYGQWTSSHPSPLRHRAARARTSTRRAA